MNHDLLHRLAEIDDPVVVPELASLERRAKRIRRRRYGRRAISAAGLAGLVTVALVALPAVDASYEGRPAVFVGISAAAAQDGARDCRVFVDSSWRPPGEWSQRTDVTPAVSYVGALEAHLESAGLHEDVGTCPPALPVAVLLDVDPTRAVTVWSDVRNPFVGSQGLESISVRGSDGQLLEQDGDARVIAWHESGKQWVAEASGIDDEELVQVLDSLAFDSSQNLAASTVPPELLSIDIAMPSDSVTTTTWQTSYDQDGVRYALSATANPAPPPAIYVSRGASTTEVRELGDDFGVYTYFGPPEDPQSGTVTWAEAGVTYTLNGPADPDRLFALAQTVVTTKTTDPLWSEAASPADRRTQ